MIIVKVVDCHDDGLRSSLGCMESDFKYCSGIGIMMLGCLVGELWLEKHRD